MRDYPSEERKKPERILQQGSDEMQIRYHRRVQIDLNSALRYYDDISDTLADDFYIEFMAGIAKVLENPKISHFDSTGLRRCNFERFPFHFLYDHRLGYIRVWVLRHDKRKPTFGTKRFGTPQRD